MKKIIFYMSAAVALSSMAMTGCIDDKESDYVKELREIKIQKEKTSLEIAKAELEKAQADLKAAATAQEVAEAQAKVAIAQAKVAIAQAKNDLQYAQTDLEVRKAQAAVAIAQANYAKAKAENDLQFAETQAEIDKANAEAQLAEIMLRKAQAQADLASLADQVEINKKQAEYDLLAINDRIALLKKEITESQRVIDAKQAELLAFYANQYSNAITALDDNKIALIKAQQNLLEYKAGIINTAENSKKIIALNNIDIKNYKNKIDTLKTYRDYSYSEDYLVQKIKELKINAGKLWDICKKAETSFAYYNYNNDPSNYDIYNDYLKSFLSRGYETGYYYQYDYSYNSTSVYIYPSTLNYNIDYSFGTYSSSYSVYQSHYYIGDDIYSDNDIDQLDYGTISYDFSISKYYFNNYGVNATSSVSVSDRRNELKNYYSSFYNYTSAVNAVETVYDIYANYSTYADNLTSKVNNYNSAVDDNYESRLNYLYKLKDACNDYYWNNYYILNYQSILNKVGDIQDLIDRLQQEIDEKTAQNEAMQKNIDDPDNYEENVASYEAVIASCKVLVESAEKELELKKAQYEAYIKTISTSAE